MLFYIIDLAIIVGCLAISFLSTMISGLSQAFFLRINVINGLLFGAAAGTVLYLNHRKYQMFLDMDIHPAICTVVGILVMIAVIMIQKTKVGFWIFAVIMSLIWAAIPVFIVLGITECDWIWGILVGVIAFILNMASHIRSRNPELYQTNHHNR